MSDKKDRLSFMLLLVVTRAAIRAIKLLAWRTEQYIRFSSVFAFTNFTRSPFNLLNLQVFAQ